MFIFSPPFCFVPLSSFFSSSSHPLFSVHNNSLAPSTFLACALQRPLIFLQEAAVEESSLPCLWLSRSREGGLMWFLLVQSFIYLPMSHRELGCGFSSVCFHSCDCGLQVLQREEKMFLLFHKMFYPHFFGYNYSSLPLKVCIVDMALWIIGLVWATSRFLSKLYSNLYHQLSYYDSHSLSIETDQ